VILAYAPGGGLGHLTRLRAVLHTLGWEGEAVAVVSASGWLADPRVAGPSWVPLMVPASCHRHGPRFEQWLREQVTAMRPRLVIVDAFPAGLLGELRADTFGAVPIVHVARLLRWERYLARVNTVDQPRFDMVYGCEPLRTEHELWLRARSAGWERLALVDPPVGEGRVGAVVAAGSTLVVHSGDEDEMAALVAVARRAAPDREVVVVGTGGLDVYPVHPLFAEAGLIVTAGGFNAVRQGAGWRDRHVAVPFERALDDQAERVRRYRQGE
jgi:hypothetical protein